MAGLLGDAGVRWVVTGGCARRLLGADHVPRDLDLEVAMADVPAAEAALGIVLRPARGAGFASLRGSGGLDGVELDVSAGVVVTGPGGRLELPDELLTAGGTRGLLAGREVVCAAPEEGLARALVAGDWARLARIAAAAGPPPRLDYLSRRLAAAIAAR